jgi:hypothetical protein
LTGPGVLVVLLVTVVFALIVAAATLDTPILRIARIVETCGVVAVTLRAAVLCGVDKAGHKNTAENKPS